MTTPIGDMVERMLSGGIPPEFIVLAVRTAEQHAEAVAGEDPVAAKRRAWDRARKAKQNSGGIPRNDENALSLTSSSSESQNSLPKEVRKKERARGEKIPPEWQPSPKHYDEGAQLGYDRAGVDSQAEDMRLWARSNEHRAVARKSNWDSTFTGWMRRNAKTPKEHRNGRDEAATNPRSALAAIRAIREQIDGKPDSPADRGTVVRLSQR